MKKNFKALMIAVCLLFALALEAQQREAAKPQEPRKMAQHLGESHDRELFAVEPGGAARGFHPGSGHPGELRTRKTALQRLDECGPQ